MRRKSLYKIRVAAALALPVVCGVVWASSTLTGVPFALSPRKGAEPPAAIHGEGLNSPSGPPGGAFAARGAVPAEQDDKPVEQVFKNIQVLKGMPRSEFPRAMDFMSAALGVDCTYCHEKAWESDAKPAKQASRSMILMMRDINDKHFGGTTTVNCATCHQGRPTTPLLPPLDQVAQRKLNEPAAAPGAASPLPTVAQVLERYVKAVGGRGAFERLKSRYLKASLALSDGTNVTREVYMKAPNKAVFISAAPGEVTSQGFNGEVGWLKNNRVRRELNGHTLSRLRFDSEFNREVRFEELFTGLRIAGREQVGGRQVYVVEAEPASGDACKFYFDAQTGLLARMLIEEESPFGSVLDQSDYSDYRDVDGVKLPFVISRTSLWENSVTRILKVEHNVSIDDIKFNLPPPS